MSWLDFLHALVVEFRDVLIIAFGAALAVVLGRISAWFDRKQQRGSLATSALTELRWLDHILREIAGKGPSRYDGLHHPALTAVISRMDVFDGETVERLVAFQTLLRDAQLSNEWFGANASERGMNQYVREIKAKAAFACQAVPDLVDCLVAAGGKKPASLTGERVAVGLPALPAPPFGKPEFFTTPKDADA